MIRLTLPVPPSLNRLWAGRRYKTNKAKNYTEDVQKVCLVSGITEPTSQPVRITMYWYPQANRGDVDNLQKLLFDSLQGFAYENDKQIQEFHVYRLSVDKKNPRIEIEIEEIE